MGLYWQKQLVVEYQHVYFKNKTMYAANKMVPALDNMDQVSRWVVHGSERVSAASVRDRRRRNWISQCWLCCV